MLKEKTSQAENECTRLQLSVRINTCTCCTAYHVHVQLYFNVHVYIQCSYIFSLFGVLSNRMFLFLNLFNEPKDLFYTRLLLI